jgi:hypothetical protein
MRIERISTLLCVLVTIVVAGPAFAQRGPGFPDLPTVELPFDDLRHWAVSVPLMYEGGQWDLFDEPMAQACHGPSDAGYTGEGASLLRVINVQGEIVRERRVGNPRIILPENPGFDEEWKPAEFAEARLVVGLAEDAYLVQFFEDAKRPEEPSFEIAIDDAVRIAAANAQQMKPACQGNNPPVVPVGPNGKYVLAYSLQMVAESVGLEPTEFLALWEENPVMFRLNRLLPQPLTVRARQMLRAGTVER